MDKKVLILMGSDSDFGVMKAAVEVLKEFSVGCDARVLSVHRAPDIALQAAAGARDAGYRVIICGAGMAAHLAGAVAAKTTLPVIGVPLQSGAMQGLDALCATVQMPPGVPVATVAIDGARNAGILALQILGTSDARIAEELSRFKKKLTEQVLEKDKKLQAELVR
ncbi:MAG TPA: 5-(carboxyamino)imidazole ribonucleotide mutase [Planctomycetota bacterium]|jgi:5-(carboxyamino)imidazole ribonucleotide mutase|nr:5-(carboxyamino)imidazole ribonucleotide mutase [Planctomycetota bacterium]